MGGEKDNNQEEELVPVEDSELEQRPEEGQQDAGDRDDDDDDDEDEGGQPSGDTRAGHAEGEEEGEDAEKATRRQERRERKERQRLARERQEKELNFLRLRNEQLEKRFSGLERRQLVNEARTIAQRMEAIKAKIAEAEEIEADAIAQNAGDDAVEARKVREAFENELANLSNRAEELRKAPALQTRRETTTQEPPPHVQLAVAWIRRNPWYKPDQSVADEDSAVVRALEDVLIREGMRPDDPGYWAELDRRVARRLPHVAGGGRSTDRGTDAPGSAEKNTRERPGTTARRSSGPKVSVGGQVRHLKPNEVYVSPERKNAMIEAGVWDDPGLRAKYLKQYAAWDREHSDN